MTLQMWTATLAAARDAWEEQSEGLNGPRKNLAQADPALLGDAVQGAADAFLTTWEQRVLDPARPRVRPRRLPGADDVRLPPHRPGQRPGDAAAAPVGGPRHDARPGGGPVTTIAVPAWLPREPELKVTEASSAVLTDVRAAATAVSDVAEWARANGAPDDFSGDAAEAADHAVTRFAGDTDAVGAALERGALAIDAFLTQMRQRRSEHADLMDRRQRLNDDREALLQRIETATEDTGRHGLQAEAAAAAGALRGLPPGPPDLARPRRRRRAGVRAGAGRGRPGRRGHRGGCRPVPRRHRRARRRSASPRHRHRRRQRVVERAVAGRAQRPADQRPRPRRQHQRHPDRRPRRGQLLGRPARHRAPPRPPGRGAGPQRVGAAVAGERAGHRGSRPARRPTTSGRTSRSTRSSWPTSRTPSAATASPRSPTATPTPPTTRPSTCPASCRTAPTSTRTASRRSTSTRRPSTACCRRTRRARAPSRPSRGSATTPPTSTPSRCGRGTSATPSATSRTP